MDVVMELMKLLNNKQNANRHTVNFVAFMNSANLSFLKTLTYSELPLISTFPK